MRIILAGLVAVLFPTIASAHGIGEVYALPVPLNYYLAGAAAAVALSFIGMAILLKRPGTATATIINAAWLQPVLFWLRRVSLLLVLLLIGAGLVGTSDFTRNFAPTYFWIYFILGYAILSLIIGNIWDKLNPWKLIAETVGIKPGNKHISGWVSVALLLMLYWWELVSGYAFYPQVIAGVLLSYSWIAVLMARYPNWFAEGEVFSVFFGTIGRIAPFKIGGDNRTLIRQRPSNWLGIDTAPAWLIAFAGVLLAGTSFDSIKETVFWSNWLDALGANSVSYVYFQTAGLLLTPVPFVLAYLGAIRSMSLLIGFPDWKLLARKFIWAVIPVAFGYVLAHNFALTILSGPNMLSIISDPFGVGWDLFKTASLPQTSLILGAKAVWTIEIGFVILAHIVGVWLSHIVALKLFDQPATATKSQYPMMALMIAFTITTLWLLSQPLVVGR